MVAILALISSILSTPAFSISFFMRRACKSPFPIFPIHHFSAIIDADKSRLHNPTREVLRTARKQLHSEDDPSQGVSRRRSRQHRNFRYVDHKPNRKRRAVTLLLLTIFVVCAVNLLRYIADYQHSRQAEEALRAIYYSEADASEPSDTPLLTQAPEATSFETAIPSAATTEQQEYLAKYPYPNNPYALIQKRFKRIRRQNQDIIGWLTIDDLLDMAVVQRDNTYYLNRDYQGYHNVNGAVFLEESCDLRTRPYTLLLYGHNMKTGAMFGNLRNYESLAYYKSHPFVTFDTAYEDGAYVIFATATVNVSPGSWAYVNFADLSAASISQRESALEKLLSYSLYRTELDVQTDDQLLLLITCTGNDDERRVVAARRIRDDESKEELEALVKRALLK